MDTSCVAAYRLVDVPTASGPKQDPVRIRAAAPGGSAGIQARTGIVMGDDPAMDETAPATWEEFLEQYSEVLWRAIDRFADSEDERMDLFVHVCDRLKQREMRRVRAYRYDPQAPCRFSTYLSVVVRNLALDFVRSRQGRYRPFRAVSDLEQTDRFIFDHHIRDGLTLAETGELLRARHGIRLTSGELKDRAARLEGKLSSNQRWRLLSRMWSRRASLSIDPTAEQVIGLEQFLPLRGRDGDPEEQLLSRRAVEALRTAVASMEPRQQLAFALLYRDGLRAAEAGAVMAASASEVERWAREVTSAIRDRLRKAGVERGELAG